MAKQTLAASTRPTPARFVALSAAAAVMAAAAALVSLLAGLQVWAMFMGWVAYNSRGHSAREGATGFACFAIGLVIAMEAQVAAGALAPVAGVLALPIVVSVVALIVVSLRVAPVVDNVLAYFLGLITVFAAHLEPTFAAISGLAAAGAIGAVAAWAAGASQDRLSTGG